MACAFNRLRHFALKFQRGTGNASRQDFSLLVQEFLQELRVFIVDKFYAAFLEAAVFFLFLPQPMAVSDI